MAVTATFAAVPAVAAAQLPPVPTVVPIPTVGPLPVPVPTVKPIPVPVPTVRVPQLPVPAPAPVVPERVVPHAAAPSAPRAPSSAPPAAAPAPRAPATPVAAVPAGHRSTRAVRSVAARTQRADGESGRGRPALGYAGPARPRAAARQRKLSRTVRRLAGCLDALPPLTARVLRLRAGTGRQAPLSREQVARRINRPRRVVRRIERRGIQRLRTACRPGGPAADGAGLPVATADGSTSSSLPVVAEAASGDAGGLAGSGDASGGEDSGADDDRGAVKGESEERPPPLGAAPATSGTDLTVPLLLAVGAGLTWLAVRDLRRRGLLG